jgi:hypothetical protein
LVLLTVMLASAKLAILGYGKRCHRLTKILHHLSSTPPLLFSDLPAHQRLCPFYRPDSQSNQVDGEIKSEKQRGQRRYRIESLVLAAAAACESPRIIFGSRLTRPLIIITMATATSSRLLCIFLCKVWDSRAATPQLSRSYLAHDSAPYGC